MAHSPRPPVIHLLSPHLHPRPRVNKGSGSGARLTPRPWAQPQNPSPRLARNPCRHGVMPWAPEFSSQDGVIGDPERKKIKTFFGNKGVDASSSETPAPLPISLKLNTMCLNKSVSHSYNKTHNIAYSLEKRLEGKTVAGRQFLSLGGGR